MVNILLPTAARPEMLRTALESIAHQTASDAIDTIFVSENGGNRASETVCADFPSLPISYIFRSPTKPIEHAKILMAECLRGRYTAILHDDDWWAPTHLANAIATLEAHPDASMYGSGHFVVSGESSMLNCCGNLFPWFSSNYASMRTIWNISRLNVLLGELLGTIAHYSTHVIRTEALRRATYVYDTNNTFDNDRMLIFALSCFGPVIFNSSPEAYVRNHGVQDCFAFDQQERIRHMCGTTRWMVEMSGKPWEILAGSFGKRMTMCPPEAIGTLKALAAQEWCLPEINRHLPTSNQLAA